MDLTQKWQPPSAAQSQIQHSDLYNCFCFRPQNTSGIFPISLSLLLLVPTRDSQWTNSLLAKERLQNCFIEQHVPEAVLALETFGNFPPVFSQSSPISLEAFNQSHLYLGSPNTRSIWVWGVHSDCRKASNTNGQRSTSLNTNRDPVVNGASSSPTQTVEKNLTSLAETASVGMKNPPGPPLPYVPDMSSVFCKITYFPCTTWQRKTYRLNI